MPEQRLFDPGPARRPERNYDPNEWAKSPDVVWHASESAKPPKPSPQPQPPGDYGMQSEEHYVIGTLHTGTLRSAVERAANVEWASHGEETREHLHPYALSGQFAPPQGNYQRAGPPGSKLGEVWDDDVANFGSVAVEHLKAGKNIEYLNKEEHKGSISYATARPENLSSWSESTLADPNAPSHHRALAEHYELVGKRSEAVKVPHSQQQTLLLPTNRHERLTFSPTQMDWDRPHPSGMIGLSQDPDVETHAKPIVHTLKRKY